MSSSKRANQAGVKVVRSDSAATLERLVSAMAHEIRNPLSTIYSAVTQVRKHAHLKDDLAMLLKIAEEEVVRLNDIIAEILEYARPKTPASGSGSPVEIADNVISSIKEKSEAAQSIEIAETSGDKNLIAVFDPELLTRALRHLISNAIDAVDPEKGKIEVDIRSMPNTRGGMIVTVRDNGCGIRPEKASSILEPFFSTKPSRLGLGLSVVKQIVEDHGGSMEIDSEPGRGSEVRLFFNQKDDNA